MRNVSWPILTQIAVPFTWAGLVIAISFIETPLKFRVPGVTEALGVAIGRVLFGTLNRIELGLALVLLAALLFGVHDATRYFLFAAIVAPLLIETIWLLPELDARARSLLNGEPPVASFHHTLFVALEIVKVVALLAFGIVCARRFGGS